MHDRRTYGSATDAGIGLRELCRRLCHLSLRTHYRRRRGAAVLPADFGSLWKEINAAWLSGVAIDPADDRWLDRAERAEIVADRWRMWELVAAACAEGWAVCVGWLDIAGSGLSEKEEVVPKSWWRCFPPKPPLETPDIAFGPTVVVRHPTIYRVSAPTAAASPAAQKREAQIVRHGHTGRVALAILQEQTPELLPLGLDEAARAIAAQMQPAGKPGATCNRETVLGLIRQQFRTMELAASRPR